MADSVVSDETKLVKTTVPVKEGMDDDNSSSADSSSDSDSTTSESGSVEDGDSSSGMETVTDGTPKTKLVVTNVESIDANDHDLNRTKQIEVKPLGTKATSDLTITPEFATPSAKLATSDTKAKVNSPAKGIGSGSEGKKATSSSPIVITPARSMGPVETKTPPISHKEVVQVSSSSMKVPQLKHVKSESDKATRTSTASTLESPGQKAGSNDKVVPLKNDQGGVESKHEAKKELATDPISSSAENKRQRERKRKIKKMEAKIKLERKLASELDKLVRKRKLKDHKLAKNRKSKKSKKDESNTESEQSQSSPEVASTSKRIAKLSDGRKLQKLAMSRAKHLGVICNGEIQYQEVLEGLKLIDKTKFVISPTFAYANFNRVHGTGLPHIQEYLVDFENRYGDLLVAMTKLHLTLARDQDQARRVAIQPDQANEFVRMWQFDNDMNRAEASALGALENAESGATSVNGEASDKKGDQDPAKGGQAKVQSTKGANVSDESLGQSSTKHTKKKKKSSKVDSE